MKQMIVRNRTKPVPPAGCQFSYGAVCQTDLESRMRGILTHSEPSRLEGRYGADSADCQEAEKSLYISRSSAINSIALD